MSFQWIIDNAEDIQINKRGVVAQTVSRDQTVRAVSRGGQIWRFTVTPASGMRWQDPGVRSYIETIDNLDRLTPATVNFSHFSYLFPYQGNGTPTGITVTQGSNTATISGGNTSAGYRLRSGDLLQLSGQPRVYTSVGDVAYNSSTVTLNRPIIEASGTYTLVLGQSCSFKIICTQIPDYRITPTGIIVWTTPFTFVESLA